MSITPNVRRVASIKFLAWKASKKPEQAVGVLAGVNRIRAQQRLSPFTLAELRSHFVKISESMLREFANPKESGYYERLDKARKDAAKLKEKFVYKETYRTPEEQARYRRSHEWLKQRGYLKSESRKKTQKKYRQSDKGKEAKRRASASPKNRAAQLRYEGSAKGFMRRSRRDALKLQKIRAAVKNYNYITISQQPPPDVALLRKERRKILDKAVTRVLNVLDPNELYIVVSMYYKERQIEEIAKDMGLTVEEIETLRNSAFNKLRGQLETIYNDYWEFPDYGEIEYRSKNPR